MTIRIKILCFFVALTLLLIALAADLWLILDNAAALSALQSGHYQADKLANELRRSSDDLTRMARSYAATGDARYLEYYRRIVAIRDGEQPYPQGYGDIFWDYVTAGRDVRPGAGAATPLIEQIKALAISDREFSLLAEAKAHSDDLTRLEAKAFAIIAASPTASGRQAAVALLHGPDYHLAKAAIMGRIDDFYSAVDNRALGGAHRMEVLQRRYLGLAILLACSMLLLSLYSYRMFARAIVRPLHGVLDWVRRMQAGEYLFEVEPYRKDEIGILAHAFAGMAEKVQADIVDLEYISSTDPLTRVKNRVTLDRVLVAELHRFERYGTPCAVLLLDVDHFKRVNDDHGHLAGDRILVALAAILVDSTRETDIVGRWGGEEFMIVCPNTTQHQGVVLAELIRTRVAAHVFSDVQALTVSLGVSAFTDELSVEKVINQADAALYRAKHAGRNRVCSAADLP